MNADMALSIVVLPEPVPPEISTLRRDPTTACSTSATCAGTLPISISRSMLIGTRANLRIDSSEPSIDSGGTTALTRLPSARRASTIGDDSSIAPADRRDDLLDDPQQMPLVLEADRRRLEHAVALDEHMVIAVDQDVGDRRILEQRLERPEAEQFVEHVADQLLALGLVERVVLLAPVPRRRCRRLRPGSARATSGRAPKVDQVQQALVKLDLEVGVRVALRRMRRRRRP